MQHALGTANLHNPVVALIKVSHLLKRTLINKINCISKITEGNISRTSQHRSCFLLIFLSKQRVSPNYGGFAVAVAFLCETRSGPSRSLTHRRGFPGVSKHHSRFHPRPGEGANAVLRSVLLSRSLSSAGATRRTRAVLQISSLLLFCDSNVLRVAQSVTSPTVNVWVHRERN